MQKHASSWAITFGLLFLSIGPAIAGPPPPPLVNHGGPVLDHYKIHVLYWGQWTKSERESEQSYLKNLTAYISGENAPAGESPTIRQYGVNSVTLDQHQFTAATDTSCGESSCGMKHPALAGPIGGPLLHSSIIYKAQHRRDDPLPGFGPHTLIVVFLPHHYVLTDCNPYHCAGAYHSSQSATEYWVVIPEDQAQWVIGHEIQEASANPAIDNAEGWGEAADPCDKTAGITLTNLGGIVIPEIVDNTQGGGCNATGYIYWPVNSTGGGISNGQECPNGKYSYQLQRCTSANGSDKYDQGPRQNTGLPPNSQPH
jgi:hypothetical protein